MSERTISRHTPGKNRAFWSATFHCKACKRPRPKIYQSRVKSKCKVCYRKYDREVHRAWRARVDLSERVLHSDRVRKRKVYPPLRRFRDALYKVRKANMYAVPDWVSEDDLLPIYEEAYRLGARVKHIVPIKARKNVCGLHVPANLTYG